MPWKRVSPAGAMQELQLIAHSPLTLSAPPTSQLPAPAKGTFSTFGQRRAVYFFLRRRRPPGGRVDLRSRQTASRCSDGPLACSTLPGRSRGCCQAAAAAAPVAAAGVGGNWHECRSEPRWRAGCWRRTGIVLPSSSLAWCARRLGGDSVPAGLEPLCLGTRSSVQGESISPSFLSPFTWHRARPRVLRRAVVFGGQEESPASLESLGRKSDRSGMPVLSDSPCVCLADKKLRRRLGQPLAGLRRWTGSRAKSRQLTASQGWFLSCCRLLVNGCATLARGGARRAGRVPLTSQRPRGLWTPGSEPQPSQDVLLRLQRPRPKRPCQSPTPLVVGPPPRWALRDSDSSTAQTRLPSSPLLRLCYLRAWRRRSRFVTAAAVLDGPTRLTLVQREPGAHTYQILRFCRRDPENDTTVLGLINTAEECVRSTALPRDDAPSRDTLQNLAPSYENYHKQRSSRHIETIVVRLNRQFGSSGSTLLCSEHVRRSPEGVSLSIMS